MSHPCAYEVCTTENDVLACPLDLLIDSLFRNMSVASRLKNRMTSLTCLTSPMFSSPRGIPRLANKEFCNRVARPSIEANVSTHGLVTLITDLK